MRDEVKHDILNVLDLAIIYISEGAVDKLNELSNHTIHNASIFQDEDSVSIAVVIYALSKIIQRDGTNIDGSITSNLKDAYKALTENNFGKYSSIIHQITKIISSLDSKLKIYIEQVVNHAQIRKGSKLYDHGISLARASEMLGISQWELMGYVGKTQIIDNTEKSRRQKARIEFARRIFNL